MTRDNVYLLIVLLMSVVCIYLIPFLKVPFFAACLLLFLVGDKNYLWFCFVFVFVQNPGFLFINQASWMINITNSVGVSFFHVFAIVALIKAIPKLIRGRQMYFTIGPYWIGLYTVALILFSLSMGMNGRSMYSLLFILLSLSLYFSIPILIGDRARMISFLRSGYFILIVLFVVQVIDILIPVKIYQLLSVEVVGDEFMDLTYSSTAVRLVYAPYLSLICLTSALYFLQDANQKDFKRSLLTTVVFVSLMSVFFTATRGWILAYAFIMFIVMMFFNQASIRLIMSYVLLIILMFYLFPLLTRQSSLVLERVSTIGAYIEGDKSAGGTLARITVRAPRVYQKFLESQLIGFGYSNTGQEYTDQHVGNYSILLEGGIVGTLVFVLGLGSIIALLISRAYNKMNSTRQVIILLAVLVAIFIIHSTSTQMFGFYVTDERMIFLILFLLFITRIAYGISYRPERN